MKRDWDRVLERLLEGTVAEWVGFAVAVVAAAVAVRWVARYRESLREDADPTVADALLVRHLKEMRERGQMSDEEYRSVKGRLIPTAGNATASAEAGFGHRIRTDSTPGGLAADGLMADGLTADLGGAGHDDAAGGQGGPQGRTEDGRSLGTPADVRTPDALE